MAADRRRKEHRERQPESQGRNPLVFNLRGAGASLNGLGAANQNWEWSAAAPGCVFILRPSHPLRLNFLFHSQEAPMALPGYVSTMNSQNRRETALITGASSRSEERRVGKE